MIIVWLFLLILLQLIPMQTTYTIPEVVGGGVYRIVVTLLDTGEQFIYYGETNNFARRWAQHKKLLLEGAHHNFRMRYLKRHHTCEFKFEVILPVINSAVNAREYRQFVEAGLVEKNSECLNYTGRVFATMVHLPNRPHYRNKYIYMSIKPLMGKRIAAIRDSSSDQLLGTEFFGGLATGISRKRFYSDENCDLFVLNPSKAELLKGRVQR